MDHQCSVQNPGCAFEHQKFCALNVDLEEIGTFQLGNVVEPLGLDRVVFVTRTSSSRFWKWTSRGVFGSNSDEVMLKLHS